jgi:hypothetical protein
VGSPVIFRNGDRQGLGLNEEMFGREGSSRSEKRLNLLDQSLWSLSSRDVLLADGVDCGRRRESDVDVWRGNRGWG